MSLVCESISVSKPFMPFPPAGAGALSRPRTAKNQKRQAKSRALTLTAALLSYDRFVPFPNNYRTELTVCFRVTLAPDGTDGELCGASGNFQLNSIFEPLDTNAHQPYGFDQVTNLYTRYRVDRAKVRVDIAASSSGNSALVIQTEPPGTASSITGVALNELVERPNCTAILVSTVGNTWERTFEMDQVTGTTKREYELNVEDYSALVTANPSRMPIMRVGCASVADNTSGYIYALVTITYSVFLFQRAVQAASAA